MKLRHLFTGIFIGLVIGQLPFDHFAAVGNMVVADTVKRVGENAAETSYDTTYLRLDGREAFSSIHSSGVFIGSDRIRTPILQFAPITSTDANAVLNYLPDGGMGLWLPGSGISSIDLSPFETQDTEALRAAIAARDGMAIVIKHGDKLRSAALTDLTGLSDAEAGQYKMILRWDGVLYGANARSL